MSNTVLNEQLAYLAMHRFLQRQYELGWREIGGLLGSMSLLSDGKPADPALAADWTKAIAAARGQLFDAPDKLESEE